MQLKRTSMTDEVFNILYERINSMHYKTGELLPSQDKLAKEMGVSRNTIREAINRLATIGILTTKQGVGTIIKSSQTRSAILQTFKDIKETSKKDAADIITSRYTIERSIVRLAAVNVTKKQLAKLTDNLAKQKVAINNNDVEQFTTLDLRFHILIADASGSKILRNLELVNLELYRTIIPEIVFNPSHMNVSYESHHNILQAITHQDPLSADKFVVEHILRVIDRLPKNFRLVKVEKAFAIEKKQISDK